ncbi:MAG: SGNH/GDSL hydrolase family protein [Gammaproteobacteria bacterium]|nr:SGNH/GDSL hydrolase family protein [Gammaproteobacteria bacterium]MDH5802939.1 SGNH/GDSL hydrolase family protein [Gammaproteobacteria bacterium]
MNVVMKRLLISLVILALWPAGVLADMQLNRIVVFGDSLSDTGNLASVVGPFPNPPYYGNRVSNGPVAVEVMAQVLNLPLQTSLHLVGPAQGDNYAVVRAMAGTTEAIDLATQTTLFLANNGGIAPADALYVVFLGGNDIRSARDTDPATAQQILEAAVTGIASQLRQLSQAGAKYWLVVMGPDIGVIPETHLIAAATGSADLPEMTTQLSKQFNRLLKRQLKSVKKDMKVKIKKFPVAKALADIVSKAEELGFTNTKGFCFSSQQGTFTPDCNYGLNFDQYIYFDEVHPTARVHHLVGKAMSEKVEDWFESDD